MLAGRVTLGARAYRPTSPGKVIAAKVAFLTEERKIDGVVPLMSASQDVVLSTLGKYRSGGLVNWGAARAEAKRTLARIGTHGRGDGALRARGRRAAADLGLGRDAGQP